MEESELLIVKRYLDECVFEPKYTYDLYSFEIQSYSGWAAGEIFNRVVNEFMKPPPCVTGVMARDVIDIIEEFAFEMDCYSERSKEDRCRNMFDIARETADDVLYFYIQERRKKNE